MNELKCPVEEANEGHIAMTETESFELVSVLEGDLKAFITLSKLTADDHWVLKLKLLLEDEPIGYTSFNLNGYTQEEAEEIAKNIKRNDFMMKEIDEFLWGHRDE